MQNAIEIIHLCPICDKEFTDWEMTYIPIVCKCGWEGARHEVKLKKITYQIPPVEKIEYYNRKAGEWEIPDNGYT